MNRKLIFTASVALASFFTISYAQASSRTVLLQYMAAAPVTDNHINVVKSALEERGYVVQTAPPLVENCYASRSLKPGDILKCPKASAGRYKDYDTWCFYWLDHQSHDREDNSDIIVKHGMYSGTVHFSAPYVYQIEAYTVNIRIIDSATDKVLISAEGYGDSGECTVKFRKDKRWDPRYAKSRGMDRSEIKGYRYHKCKNDTEQQVRIAVEAALSGR